MDTANCVGGQGGGGGECEKEGRVGALGKEIGKGGKCKQGGGGGTEE